MPAAGPCDAAADCGLVPAGGPSPPPASCLSSPVSSAGRGAAGLSGLGGVPDLGELFAGRGGAGVLGVVGDADARGVQVCAHLPDARLAGQVALDVLLALGAGDARCRQLDGCPVHTLTPSLEAVGTAGVAVPRRGGRGAVPKRRSRSALPTTVTELVAIATAASTGGRMPAAASGTSVRL